MMLLRVYAVGCSLALPLIALSQANNLGTAHSFAVLGATTVTNTGDTVLVGDLGVSPGSAITGFPPGTVYGTTYVNDAVALQARADANAAYVAAAGLPVTADLSGTDLGPAGGRRLTAAVYRYTTSAQLSEVLILDAEGDPNALFVFQIGSTLTTGPNSAVVLQNGTQECNIIWQVGSSATLGLSSSFSGILLAQQSITATTGTTVSGSLFGLNAAVTLDTTVVNNVDTCASSATTTTQITSTTVINTATGVATVTSGETIVVTVTGSLTQTESTSTEIASLTQTVSATTTPTAVASMTATLSATVTNSQTAVLTTTVIPPVTENTSITTITSGSSSSSAESSFTPSIFTTTSGLTTFTSTSILSSTITFPSTTLSSTSTIFTLTITSPSSTLTRTESIATESTATQSISTIISLTTTSASSTPISTESTTTFTTSLSTSTTLCSSSTGSSTSRTTSYSSTTTTITTCSTWSATYYEKSCTCYRTQARSSTYIYTTVLPCTTAQGRQITASSRTPKSGPASPHFAGSRQGAPTLPAKTSCRTSTAEEPLSTATGSGSRSPSKSSPTTVVVSVGSKGHVAGGLFVALGVAGLVFMLF